MLAKIIFCFPIAEWFLLVMESYDTNLRLKSFVCTVSFQKWGEDPIFSVLMGTAWKKDLLKSLLELLLGWQELVLHQRLLWIEMILWGWFCLSCFATALVATYYWNITINFAWKGPLGIIGSNILLKVADLEAFSDCSGHCTVRCWKFPRMEVFPSSPVNPFPSLITQLAIPCLWGDCLHLYSLLGTRRLPQEPPLPEAEGAQLLQLFLMHHVLLHPSNVSPWFLSSLPEFPLYPKAQKWAGCLKCSFDNDDQNGMVHSMKPLCFC